MRCDRCGETMRPETVITLRRSLGRIRATHAQRAWCSTCGTTTSPVAGMRPGSRSAASGWARLAFRITARVPLPHDTAGRL